MSILAIEQLTGAVTVRPVVIGASASSSAGASGAEAAVRLDDARKDLQAKTASQAGKQDAFNKLNGDTKNCDVIATAVANKKEGDLSEALKGKRTDCEKSASDLTQTKADKTASSNHYSALSSAIGSGGTPVSSTGSLMTQAAAGGLDSSQAGDAVASVAQAVKAIVKDTFSQDEYLYACLKLIFTEGVKDSVRSTCNDYLQTKIDLEGERAQAALSEAALQDARNRFNTRVAGLFDKFWTKVSTSDVPDPAKLSSVKGSVKEWPVCMDSSKTKADFKRCFDATRADPQRQLAK